MRATLLFGILFAPALSAQELISPFGASSREGNSNNTIPWASPTHRYQQIHGDLRSRSVLLRSVSWRRDGVLPPQSSAVGRTIDGELRMARSSYASVSTRFIGNYLGPVTQVVNRKPIALPDCTGNQGSPAPWGILIPFDTPYSQDGSHDLVWELLVHSTTFNGPYYLDAHSGYGENACYGLTRPYGMGCVVTGNSVPMGISMTVSASRPANLLTAVLTVTEAVPSAPAVILLGGAELALTLPGFCTQIYVAPAVTIPGLADASGAFSTGPLILPFEDTFPGRSLFGQGACADVGRAGMPYAGSQGLEVVLPDLPARIRRVWSTDVVASTGVMSEVYDYGLVTRFGQ